MINKCFKTVFEFTIVIASEYQSTPLFLHWERNARNTEDRITDILRTLLWLYLSGIHIVMKQLRFKYLLMNGNGKRVTLFRRI